MKRKTTFIISIFVSLFLLGFNLHLISQEYSEYHHGYDYLANSDSRIVTSIKEVGEEVHLEVLAIGHFYFGSFSVSLYYDPAVVVPIMGSGGPDITLNLTTPTAMSSYLWLNPALPDVSSWRSISTGNVYASSSPQSTSVTISGSNPASQGLVLESGDILQVFKLFFRKLPGQVLSATTFTYYNRTLPPVQQNQYYKGAYIRQTGVDAPPVVNLYPQLFTRRSPATIEPHAPAVHGTRVILRGLANAEHIAKQTDPIQLLDWDQIVSTGFIYSTHDVSLTIDEYSKKITANGVDYDFPVISEGVFTLGGYTFHILTTENTNNATRVEMQETLRGLEADVPYYAYAFMTYKFQTSHVYPVLGTPITFTPALCDDQPLVLHETEFSVCNTVSGISLPYDNYTESATYKLMFDAAGLEAGFVNMDDYVFLPASQIDISIPYNAPAGTYTATLFVREGECEKDYFVTIALTTSPEIVSTSATEVFVKDGEEFYLLVEATGATSFQWYFEGITIPGATQFFYSDIFNVFKEGTYSVNIINECGIRTVDFEVKQALGIPDDITISGYKLTAYPNPNLKGSILYLQLEVPVSESIEAVAQILDVTGKEVSIYHLSSTLTELTLNVAEGAYLIKVSTKSGKELLTKIIVQQ
jgi:hypothetical protein